MSNNQRQSSNGSHSWATVAGSQDPAPISTPISVQQSGKMAFKPRGGKSGKGGKNVPDRGQRSQASQPSNPSVPKTATFRDQYLQQIKAAEQPNNRNAGHDAGSTNQGAGPAKEAANVAGLTALVSSLKATNATLRDDINRRSQELVAARVSIDSKNSDIEDLKKKLVELESAQANSKESGDEIAAKDKEIMELKYKNACLRDAMHNGIISIARIYGPGSDHAFESIAEKEMDEMEKPSNEQASGGQNPQHAQNSQMVSTSSSPSPHTGPQRQTNKPASDSRIEAQKIHDTPKKEDIPSKKTDVAPKVAESLNSMEKVGSQSAPADVSGVSADGRLRPASADKIQYLDLANNEISVQDDSSSKGSAEDSSESVDGDGWVVQSKKKRSKKAKGKAQNKQGLIANGSATSHNGNATNPAPKGNWSPAQNDQRLKTQKKPFIKTFNKPYGTVIGSKSAFSQAANESNQKKDEDASKKDSPVNKTTDAKQHEKTPASPYPEKGINNSNVSAGTPNGGKQSQGGSPQTTTQGRAQPTKLTSWADEVEDFIQNSTSNGNAHLQQTFD